ncbi:hypothetical protein BCEN4_520165 [Burkholderia cenocepacia]|nr:hypothetical protein BCEN4_520165 [Burkholderia cenocepacia]
MRINGFLFRVFFSVVCMGSDNSARFSREFPQSQYCYRFVKSLFNESNWPGWSECDNRMRSAIRGATLTRLRHPPLRVSVATGAPKPRPLS